MPDLAQAALYYAQRLNWAVLPLHTPDKEGGCSCGVAQCKSAGKHPRVQHGVHDASKDKAQILDWWRQWPDANIGLAAGEVSGVIVIDVDPRNKGNRSIRKLGKPDSSLIAITGGGGKHYFVNYTEAPIEHKPAEGIDIQADNRIVVLAPSLHSSGKRYKWLDKPRRGFLGDLPDWAQASSRNGASSKKDERSNSEVIFREGERNDALTRRAGRLRRAGASEEGIYADLVVYNRQRCYPPLGDSELRQIAHSVMRYEPSVADEDQETLPLTDKGYALRFQRRHGEDLRYSKSLGWLEWTGAFWQPDREDGASFRILDVANMLRHEAEGLEEKETAVLKRKADLCESSRGVAEILRMAKNLPGLSAAQHQWDANPWTFNVENGALDLHIDAPERFREHRREDHITKTAPVVYNADAKAPVFRRFIMETFKGDKNTVRYIQKLLGHALTGIVTEQVFPVFWGIGANGKSTLIEHAIGPVFGPYLVHLTAETLLAQKYVGHPTELMDLRGARLAIAVESGKARSLDEEIIKKLTGDDTIKARRMHMNPEVFKTTHKLILVTNNKPRTSASEAIWRRLRLVAFTNVLPPAEWDKTLDKKLEAESSGILNWLIQGCLAWQRSGLTPPASVLRATRQHHDDQDLFGSFVKETLIFDTDYKCSVPELYNAYQRWCADGSVKPLGKINFNREIIDRFGDNVDKYLSNGQQKWRGIRPILIVKQREEK